MIGSWLIRSRHLIEMSRFQLVLNSSVCVCVILALTKQRFSLNCVGTSIWLSEDTNWLRGGWINTRPRHMVNDALIPGVPALSRLVVWQ